MADGKLALDLETNDKENRVKSRSLIHCNSDSEKPKPLGSVPKSLSQNAAKPCPKPVLVKATATIVAKSRRAPAEGPPAGEIERRRAHLVTERAWHRISQRAFVPWPVATAAIDE
jgi:hypothetical protein